MIDPKGPKPDHDRPTSGQAPRFDESGSGADAPMYATEPSDATAGDSPAGGFVAGGSAAGAAGAAGSSGGASAAGSPGGAGSAGSPGGAGSAGSPGGAGSSATLDSLSRDLTAARDALAVAEAKSVANFEQFLRASADIENVRKRAQEDVSKAHKFAIEGFAESMLPVRDSLEMALKVESPSIESLREGVEATLRQLTQAFDRHRLMVIDPLHQKFDPNQHQAISMVPSREVAPNHVVTVLQKGYLINDRVLRPALVAVSQSG